MPELLRDGLFARMAMEHGDKAGLHTGEEMESPGFARRFTIGRKSEGHISGGQFVARLAKHFGLLTDEILGGLKVIAPEHQMIDMAELPDAAAGAPVVAQDALIDDEGGQARMAKLEEDVHEIHGALTEQREVLDTMTRDFSRFSTWVTTGLGRMMDRAGVTYTPYSQTHMSYQRHVRQRTGKASTSAAK
ncbi:hypothetical protein Tco_0401356 [Tanacetum coccineum]